MTTRIALCLLSLALALSAKELTDKDSKVTGEDGTAVRDTLQQVQKLDHAVPNLVTEGPDGIFAISSLSFEPPNSVNHFIPFPDGEWVDMIGGNAIPAVDGHPFVIQCKWLAIALPNADCWNPIIEGRLFVPISGGGGQGPAPEPPQKRWGVETDVASIDIDINVDNHPKKSGVPTTSSLADISETDEALEDSRGGYLWVNDDNDEAPAEDSVLDIDDNSNGVAGEDDLVPVTVKICGWKEGSSFKITLTQGASLIRVWSQADKKGLMLDAKTQEITISYGDPRVKVIKDCAQLEAYLEGLLPGIVRIKAELSGQRSRLTSDSIMATVFAVEKTDWASGKSGGSSSTASSIALLDRNPAAQGGGWRFFPDYDNPDKKGGLRDILCLATSLTPSIPSDTGWELPVHCHIRDIDHYAGDMSFDAVEASVDSEGHNPAFEPNDNRKGNSCGLFKQPNPVLDDKYLFGLSAVAKDFLPSQEAASWSGGAESSRMTLALIADFSHGGRYGTSCKAYVRAQEHTPCNNWRYAAGMGNTIDKAVRISVTPNDGQTLTTIDDKTLRLHKSSEPITLWRRLFYQRWKMGKADLTQNTNGEFSNASVIQGIEVLGIRNVNFEDGSSGTVIKIKKIKVDENSRFGSTNDPSFFCLKYNDRSILTGKIYDIKAAGSHEIEEIILDSKYADEINRIVSDRFEFARLTITDDDVDPKTLGNKVIEARRQCEISKDDLYASELAPVCILPVVVKNTNNEINFKIATDILLGFDSFFKPTYSGSKDCWISHLVGIYQFSSKDGDSKDADGKINVYFGYSYSYWNRSKHGIATISAEAFMEILNENPSFTSMHELGHLLGARHEDKGLMQEGGGKPPLTGISLRRIMLIPDEGP